MDKPRQHTVTLRDVGRALGVSHVTVSLALRNSSRVSASRRKQIQAKAEEMGYRPNAMAAALAHYRMTSHEPPVSAALAWLNFWESPDQLRKYSEFDSYWRGAFDAAEKFGYRLDEFPCHPSRLSLSRLEGILLSRGITGILLPPQRFDGAMEAFAWEKFSAVRFGRSVPNLRLHMVTADQVANAILAFDKARALGYRRIGFISSEGYFRGALFVAGFMVAQLSVPASERLPVLQLRDGSRADQVHLERWLKRTRPDAILTDLRFTADMLAKAGCRVPDDVGLAAMSILDGQCDTGINQNPVEIGRVALLALVSLVHDGDRGIPPIFRQILVEGEWVQGKMLPERADRPAKERRRKTR